MIKFVEIDSEKIISDIKKSVENKINEKISIGDERNLFIHGLAPIVVGIANKINVTANQNLLRYAIDDKLNGLAENIYTTIRQKPTKSRCKGKIKLSIVQDEDKLIKSGTKVTPDGTLMFEVESDTIVEKGDLEAETILVATETGEKYNGFEIGKINYIVDPIPYVEKIENVEISKEGSDLEKDESYRERSRLSMEKLSTAGPIGAYEYFAMSADNSITSVKVISPTPGVVKIIVIVDNGEIPSKEILSKVLNECSQKDRRPLTDKVEVVAPEIVKYNIELTYYLDRNFPIEESNWRKKIEGDNLDFSNGAIREFIKWQQEKIGRAINPDELKYQIQNSASYEVNGRRISGVRKIEVESPSHVKIDENKLAKVGTITIKYGGME